MYNVHYTYEESAEFWNAMLRDRYYIRRENRQKLVQLIFICFSHYIIQDFSLYIFLSRAFHCIYFCPGLVEILRQKWRQEPTGNPSGVYQELSVRRKNKNFAELSVVIIAEIRSKW